MTRRKIGGVEYTLTYDAENRLVAYTGGSINMSFVYDGDGNRILARQTNGDRVGYVGDYEAVYNSAGTNTAKRVYYRVGPARVMQGYGTVSGIRYLLTDHQGSTIAMASDTALLGTLVYSPWGYALNGSGAVQSEVRYTGQHIESSIGIYYYGARWYDPYLNRWLSPDSLVPDPSKPVDWDRFAYVRGNPVNFSDPSGHFALPAMLVGAGIGALVGGIIGGATYYATNQQNFDNNEFLVATGAGAAAGAFVGSGLGILSAATTATAAATATAMVSGGSSAAITEAMYMAENQNKFETAPFVTNTVVSGAVAAATANPSMSLTSKVAINVAGNEINYLSNTNSRNWSWEGAGVAAGSGALNAVTFEVMSMGADQAFMMNNPIGKQAFQGQGCHPSYTAVANSERLRTGVGNALLGLGSGFTSAMSNWFAQSFEEE